MSADAFGPDAKGFVGRILERLRAARYCVHLRAEQTHHLDVERLTLDVARAHVDVDRQAELRADGRRRDAVLTRAGLGEQPAFTHAPREQRLADGIVDLMRAGVIGIFALHQQRHGRDVARVSLAAVERRWAADEIAEHGLVLVPESGIGESSVIARSSSSSAAINTSGTKRPPNSPK